MAAPATKQTGPKLYELADEYTFLAHRYLAIMEEIEEAEGVMNEAQEKALDEVTERLNRILDGAEDKVLNIARMIVQSETEAAALKGEEDRVAVVGAALAKRRKRIEKANEFFKRYILDNLARMNVEKVQDGQTAVAIRKSEAVEVINPSILPVKYLRRATVEMALLTEESKTRLIVMLESCNAGYSTDPDKMEIKRTIKGGTEVPGAEIKINRSLKIS